MNVSGIAERGSRLKGPMPYDRPSRLASCRGERKYPLPAPDR